MSFVRRHLYSNNEIRCFFSPYWKKQKNEMPELWKTRISQKGAYEIMIFEEWNLWRLIDQNAPIFFCIY